MVKCLKLPLANENFLVEDGAVGTKEGCFNGLAIWYVGAHVEDLTARLYVGVVACVNIVSIKFEGQPR